MNIAGGAAIPVVVVTDAKVEGITARPVYGYQTKPTDRPVTGGKARRVKVIAAADLRQNGGQYILSGEPYAMPVYTDPSGETDGGTAMVVYPINAWPSSTSPVVIPWYLSGGILAPQCAVAYQSKGAASLAASYVNLNNPGTNDFTPGSGGAPAFNTATGWTFSGTKSLVSSVSVAAKPFTYIIRLSGNGTAGNRTLIGGVTPAPAGGYSLDLNPATNTYRVLKQDVAVIGTSTAGFADLTDVVIGVTYTALGVYTFYLNGAPNGTGTDNQTANANTLQIATQDDHLTPFPGTIKGLALYTIALNGTLFAAVSTALAAL